MIKRRLKLFTLLFILSTISLLFLISCSSKKNPSMKDENNIEFYIGSKPYENKNIKIDYNEPNCKNSFTDYYTVIIDIYVTNKTNDSITYNLSDVELIDESSSTEYSVSNDESIDIDSNNYKYISFTAAISSNIRDDNYKLLFSIDANGIIYNITYHLYEIPDELREDITLKYYIDNNLVHTDVVKSGKVMTDEFYIHESGNTYCERWFYDSKCTKYARYTRIREDTNLYGKLESVFDILSSDDVEYASLISVRYSPSNKTLVVPEKYEGKYIKILGITCTNIDKIYIPKAIISISSTCFYGYENIDIYFEGTEDEWKALFPSYAIEIPENVRYNVTMPY